ncbi:MAG: RNA 2',3'-cyclic phosphodiesterase [Actinomycetota bacterium]|nr:RNA 2',3'-cyclic phosphodiesterase [Actinomycetota bacterium]
MRRLFVAVWPPEDVLDSVAALPRPEVEGLRWTDRDQWHVTLRFLGPVPEVDPVVEALAGVAPVRATTAVLGPALDRLGRRILHVPVNGLDEVAASVVARTSPLGKQPEDRPFHGHVTLARVAKRARVDLRALTGTPVDATWDVDSICLVESRLHPAGARYQVLERFSLTPPRPNR